MATMFGLTTPPLTNPTGGPSSSGGAGSRGREAEAGLRGTAGREADAEHGTRATSGI